MHELGPCVGILGGMGPLAAIDLQSKILARTHARWDADHVPVVTHNVAQIPDRLKFLAGLGPTPVPAMQAGIARLNQIGARLILIPCNTAHIWYDELAQASEAPITHIADACVDVLREGPLPACVGILATGATLASGIYQRRLQALGIDALVNTDEEMSRWVTPAVYAVKAGQVPEGGRGFHEAAKALVARGAQRILLACTEIPIGLASIGSSLLPFTVDATDALAARAVDWWVQQQHSRSLISTEDH